MTGQWQPRITETNYSCGHVIETQNNHMGVYALTCIRQPDHDGDHDYHWIMIDQSRVDSVKPNSEML